MRHHSIEFDNILQTTRHNGNLTKRIRGRAYLNVGAIHESPLQVNSFNGKIPADFSRRHAPVLSERRSLDLQNGQSPPLRHYRDRQAARRSEKISGADFRAAAQRSWPRERYAPGHGCGEFAKKNPGGAWLAEPYEPRGNGARVLAARTGQDRTRHSAQRSRAGQGNRPDRRSGRSL